MLVHRRVVYSNLLNRLYRKGLIELDENAPGMLLETRLDCPKKSRFFQNKILFHSLNIKIKGIFSLTIPAIGVECRFMRRTESFFSTFNNL